MKNRLLIYSLALAALLSCSVKEKRDVCPGYLTVNIIDDGRINTKVGMVGWNDSQLFRHEHDTKTEGLRWVKTVMKQDFTFGAWCGHRTAVDKGHCIEIPYGDQCDSLYAFYAPVSLGETYSVDVKLKKQFVTVRLDLNQSAASMRALTFRVVGNTNGFDLYGFTPTEGTYFYEFNTSVMKTKASSDVVERTASFRVPRQIDDSLDLEVISPIGAPLNTIHIGQIVKQMGYDWNRDELDDIFISIDFQYAIVEITVEGWEDGIILNWIEC